MSVEMLGKGWKTKALVPPAVSPDDYLIVQDSLAAAVERGRVFAACIQGTGIVTQAGLSATDAILALYNPSGSGVVGRVWYAGVAFSVAFVAAAAVWLAAGTNTVAAAVTGTAATLRNLKLGGGAINTQGNVVQAFTTATLPAAPVAIHLLGMGLTGAITTMPQIAPLGRWFNGALLVKPGTNLSPQTSTASGAAAGFAEFIWEEVDE